MSDLGNIASPDAFVLYLWGPTGPVMEFDTQGHSKTFLHDPLGNVVNTTTEDGRAQKPLFYDGYGLPVWPDEVESQRVRRQPFQYKGQFGYYTDVHTGLSYCHNRYYDPRMGRWLSRDPIGLAGGTNVYTYCSGDPVNLVDPDGLQVGPPTGLAGYEDCIPIWGAGRDAINEFQTGKYGWGVFHTLVAVSDVFLVKSIVVGASKTLGKVGLSGARSVVSKQGLRKGTATILNNAGIWKSGSHSWGATRKWALKHGHAEPFEPLHHWLIAQNSFIGKLVPNAIKNQPWNLKAIKTGAVRGASSAVGHAGIHGKLPLKLNYFERLFYGVPGWSLLATTSTIGHGVGHFGRKRY